MWPTAATEVARPWSEREAGPDEPGRWRSLKAEERMVLETMLEDRSQCFNWDELPAAGLTMVVRCDEQELLRKEVIQPHLPVRLPCYDFTPIANPTFDSSLPCGLGHWLRVLPTFVV